MESLQRYLARDPVQHIGVNVRDMAESKKFYSEVLGGEFITEIDGITGSEWNTILNGSALSDGKKVPDLASGHALHVAFYSFGNMAVELLRYYDVATGQTFDGPVVGANEQGPAGMHICFNLDFNADSTEFIAALKEKCKGMPKVSINTPEIFNLPKSGGPMDGWCIAFMSGPNEERIEFVQLAEDSNATKTFSEAAVRFRATHQKAKQEAGAAEGTKEAQGKEPKGEQPVEHVVLMVLKNTASEEELAKATEQVMALETAPGVLSFSFGPTTTPERSGPYTHCLVSRHANVAAAKAYQVHEAHVRVRDEVLGPLIDRTAPLPVLAVDIPANTNGTL